MDTVKTKDGDFDVKQFTPGERSKVNRYRGDVVIEGRNGETVVMRPTFEAALDIEDAIGGLDSLNMRVRAGGVPGIEGIRTREIGVIIAAGAKAAGDERATPLQAAKFAWSCDRDALRKPLADFLYALTHGGRARVEDLGNGASPGASPGDIGANETAELMTGIASSSDAS